MKQRLLSIATALFAVAAWSVLATACEDKVKGAEAAAVSNAQVCTAKMAANCTPAQAAACKAKGASAAAGCPFHTGASAVVVSSDGAGESPACKAHGAGAATAVVAGSGKACGGRGMTSAAGEFSHGSCDACADMASCEQALKAARGLTQVVTLKNGIMFVYTADGPGRVRALQAAISRRNEHLTAMTAAGDNVALCPECKSLRGAVKSGKLNREMVNIEGGCLTLMTSNDPAIVAKLHAMVSPQSASRVKI